MDVEGVALGDGLYVCVPATINDTFRMQMNVVQRLKTKR